MTLRNLISHVCETRKIVMAILEWKYRLLCDKSAFEALLRKLKTKIRLYGKSSVITVTNFRLFKTAILVKTAWKLRHEVFRTG